MSLETLLEAAEFIDCERDKNGRTRVKHTENFHPYAKPEQSGQLKSPKPRLPVQKNRRRSASGTSTEEEPLPVPLPTKYSAIASGNRDLHNRLEKNRRAQLKNCFEQLKAVIPVFEDDRKASNLSILRSATRHIQMLRRQETELEIEMQKLARHKIMSQERIAQLKHELAALNIDIDLNAFIKAEGLDDNHSTSTATADNDDPIMSDDDAQSSSTLSTTSTTPGTPVFKVPSSSVSPQKSPMMMHPQQTSHQATTQSILTTTVTTEPIIPPVTMQSILNRTLLGAATSVLSSLTSNAVTSSIRPMGHVVRNIASISTPQTSQKVQGPQTSSKSSVNQILQRTLQQRQLLKKDIPANHMLWSKDGIVIASGPASITKLVSQNQADCHISSGINLSSLTTAHLNTPAVPSQPKSQYAKSTGSNWSNPPSVTDGPVQVNSVRSEPLPVMPRPSEVTTPATIPLNRLLPSLYPTPVAPTPATTAIAVTTVTLPASAITSNIGSNILTLQSAATATSSTSSRPTPIIAAPSPLQAQMISPAQLQQLLLQTSFQQQLAASQQQSQQQKTVAVLPHQQQTTAAGAKLQVISPATTHHQTQNQPPTQTALQINNAQLAAQLLNTQNATVAAAAAAGSAAATATTPGVSNVNQINLPLIQMAQLISPLPQLQLASNLGSLAGVQLNQVLSPQVIKTFGQVPTMIQPSAITLPIKPVVMVSIPNMIVPTSQSTLVNTTAGSTQLAMTSKATHQ